MSAYINYQDNSRVIIYADSSGDRRSRAAQANVVKRAWEKENKGVRRTLTLYHKSYSETPGFLARSAFYYRIVLFRRSIVTHHENGGWLRI